MTRKKLKDPGTIPDLPDLMGQQADFFEDYFKKGAEFTRALIAENEELRRQIAAAERGPQGSTTHETTSTAIEREHYDLACLFVAQGQLARARNAHDVLDVIAEILLNFVGADRFAIYAADSSRRLRPIFASGGQLTELGEAPETVVAAFSGRPAALDEVLLDSRPLDGDALTSFPLVAGDEVIGCVGVWSFLRQKASLAPIDDRLLGVISDVGGAALEAARVRGQSPRLIGTPDYYNGLALLLGIGGRGG